ncbi:MAG: hypothetical protein JKY65_22510 [Planctomycetes bacterium]|nr:hypothetical protein [Planctomycetota bacterium]
MANGWPKTSWTEIARATSANAETRQAALGQLVGAYEIPIKGWLRRQNLEEPIEDLFQGFFAHLIENDLAAKVGESPQFRAYLQACLRNHVRDFLKARGRLKRGGGQHFVPADSSLVDPKAPSPWEELDRGIALALFQHAAKVLKRSPNATAGRRAVFDRYAEGLLSGRDESAKDCAEALGLTENDVKNDRQWARDKLKEVMVELIRAQCDPEFVGKELEYFMSLVKGS